MESLSSTQKSLLIAGAGLIALFGVKVFLDHQQDTKLELGDIDLDISTKQPIKTKISGLYNYGNTCFINSVIQALSSIRQFQQNLQQLKNDRQNHKNSNKYNFEFIEELLESIKSINSTEADNVISISNVLDALFNVSKQLCNSEQQDSHQFFLVVASCIDQIYSRQGQLSLSSSFKQVKSLDNVLIGFTQSCIECNVCKIKRSIKLQAFYNLSLQINSLNINSLESALAQFQSNEYLNDVNCRFCTINKFVKDKQRLKQRIKAINSINQIQKETLYVYLDKLIKYSQKLKIIDEQIEQTNKKMSDFIDNMQKDLLPLFEQLQKQQQNMPILYKFMQGFEQIKTSSVKKVKISKFPKVLVIHFKRLVMDNYTGDMKLLTKFISFPTSLSFEKKRNSQISNQSIKSQSQQLLNSLKQRQYILTSLIAYVGSGLSGHYYAFRKKHRDTSKWFYVSDKYVKGVDQFEVKKQIAYMLFYQR